MPIVPASRSLTVDHLLLLLVGQPGLGKTSLGYSCQTLLVDCDQGAHRAVNRRDTLVVSSWRQMRQELRDGLATGHYSVVTLDTGERVVALLAADVMARDSRYGGAGTPSQMGWGVIRREFRAFLDELLLTHDVVLIAHAKEVRDGEVKRIQADIPGGSYGEILKRATAIGYLAMVGHTRTLDFSPTDRRVGKNPGEWAPIAVPPAHAAQGFLSDLLERMRSALADKAERDALTRAAVDAWRHDIEQLDAASAFTATYHTLRDRVKADTPGIYEQVYPVLVAAARAAGMKWDKALDAFVFVGKPPIVHCARPALPSVRSARVATVQPELLSDLTRAS